MNRGCTCANSLRRLAAMEGNMMDLPLNLHTIFKRNELWSRRMVVSCMDDNTIHRYTYAGVVA